MPLPTRPQRYRKPASLVFQQMNYNNSFSFCRFNIVFVVLLVCLLMALLVLVFVFRVLQRQTKVDKKAIEP